MDRHFPQFFIDDLQDSNLMPKLQEDSSIFKKRMGVLRSCKLAYGAKLT